MVIMITAIPMIIHHTTHHKPYQTHSLIIPKLAAIMSPAAIDLAIPTQRLEIFLRKKNGTAPSPHASAVIRE